MHCRAGLCVFRDAINPQKTKVGNSVNDSVLTLLKLPTD